MVPKSNHYKVIVGIDYGTTFSGWSWARISAGEDPLNNTMIKNRCTKSSSILSYSKVQPKVHSWGSEAEISLKCTINPGLLFAEKTKLHLDRNVKDNLPALPHGLSAIQVIGAYLSQMYSEIYNEIEKRHGIDISKVMYCMTVPTTWSEHAKSNMRLAAIFAGIISEKDEASRLLIVDEAVAAAIYAERVSPELNMTIGNTYMICDAGGGTVDIAMFEKTCLNNINSLRELTVGTGSSCGSDFLDKNFKSLLTEKLGGRYNCLQRPIKDILHKFSSTTKRTFDGNTKNTSGILLHFDPIPTIGELRRGATEDIIFTVAEIQKRVFDPVVKTVLEMIRKHLEKLEKRKLDVMFITGGFGNSPYLRMQIKKRFCNQVKCFKYIQDGDMAVMKGAVLFGLNSKILIQRIVRRTYGIILNQTFDGTTSTHHRRESGTGKFYVYIRKGELISDGKWATHKIPWRGTVFPAISLYAYDGDEPIPMYPSAEDIELVATYNSQFSVNIIKMMFHPTLTMSMRFGLDSVEANVELSKSQYKYATVMDVSGEKSLTPYEKIHPSFEEKYKKRFMMYIIDYYFP